MSPHSWRSGRLRRLALPAGGAALLALLVLWPRLAPAGPEPPDPTPRPVVTETAETGGASAAGYPDGGESVTGPDGEGARSGRGSRERAGSGRQAGARGLRAGRKRRAGPERRPSRREPAGGKPGPRKPAPPAAPAPAPAQAAPVPATPPAPSPSPAREFGWP